MRPRLALVGLAAIVTLVALSYTLRTWPWSRQPDAKEVRWPATSPLDRELARAEDPDEPTEPLLPPTEVAPGVRVREGIAHDISYF